jgi:hypothetical protein
MEIEVAAAKSDETQPVMWPTELPKQIAVVRDLVTTDGRIHEGWSVDRVAQTFKGARKKEIESVLDSLAALGLLIAFETPQGKRWRPAAV